jgi:hypothetical protein
VLSLGGNLGCSQEPKGSTESPLGTAREAAALSATQVAKLGAHDPWPGDGFGNAVALSRDRLLVGSSNDDIDGANSDNGSAFVFARSGDVWIPEWKFTVSDGLPGGHFGSAVDIAGDWAAIGASGRDVGMNVDQGAVFVFHRYGSAWTQTQMLVAANGLPGDEFGSSLALDGNTLVVGARETIRVFVRSGELFGEQQEIRPPLASGAQRVALSGNTLAVGSPQSGPAEQGAVNIYGRITTEFEHDATLHSPGRPAQEHFGHSVAASGNLVMIGINPTAGPTSFPGALVYEHSPGGGLNFAGQFHAFSDGNESDQFGYAVAIDGNIAAVSAILHEHGGVNENHGAVYLF